MGTSLAISRRRPAGLLIHALPVTLSLACLMLVLASETQADGCCFTGGPSVRVSPNARVEIRWTANFVGDGKVEIFDHPNGGVPIDGKTSPVQGAGHTIEFSVGGVLHPDTTHYPRAGVFGSMSTMCGGGSSHAPWTPCAKPERTAEPGSPVAPAGSTSSACSPVPRRIRGASWS